MHNPLCHNYIPVSLRPSTHKLMRYGNIRQARFFCYRHQQNDLAQSTVPQPCKNLLGSARIHSRWQNDTDNRDVKSLRPKWAWGQNFGLGLGLASVCSRRTSSQEETDQSVCRLRDITQWYM